MPRIKFQEPLKGCRIDIERLEDRLRGDAAFDQPIGDEQAARRLAPRIKFGQADKGKADRVGIRGEPLTVGFVPIPLGQDSPRPEN